MDPSLDIHIKGYVSQDILPDRSRRQTVAISIQPPVSQGQLLRKQHWEFMKKAYDWKCIYTTGYIGDTVLVYVPPGIARNKQTMIKNLEYYGMEDFESHLQENRVLMMTWWELWDLLSNKGWKVKATAQDDVFEYSWASSLVPGVTRFSSKIALMQYIARFPYPLQSPSQLADTLRRHGWTISQEIAGISYIQPGTSTRYTYDTLVRSLFENPTLFFSSYFNESKAEIESRIREAIIIGDGDLVVDLENSESVVLSGMDNSVFTSLRKTLDNVHHLDDNPEDTGVINTVVNSPFALLKDLLLAFGWRIGQLESEDFPAGATVWWKWMSVYRPPYAVYSRGSQFAKLPANASPNTQAKYYSETPIFGRDYFFDVKHVVALLLKNMDYVYATRPSLSVALETKASFIDFSDIESGKEYSKKMMYKICMDCVTSEDMQEARQSKQLDEMLRTFGWQVFQTRSGLDIFIPPTSRTMKISHINFKLFKKGVAYYTSVEEVRDYFIASLHASFHQTIRSAVSTAHSTPNSSPDSVAEKQSLFQLACHNNGNSSSRMDISDGVAVDIEDEDNNVDAMRPIINSQPSPIRKFLSNVTIQDENVIVSERDIFYWQSLKIYVRERFHGEILGALVKLGWGHYGFDNPWDLGIIYCAPEMTEALTERNIAVGTKLSRRYYSNYVRGDDYFFDLTDAEALWEKVSELVADDRNLAMHARSRQHYFRQFNPGKVYPGTLPEKDFEDITMLPMLVSTLEDKPLKSDNSSYTPSTQTSTLSMDTQGSKQKISAFFDLALLLGKQGKLRYGDVMPLLKRIGWGVKYLDDRAVLCSPFILRGDYPSVVMEGKFTLDKKVFTQLTKEGVFKRGVHYFYEDMDTNDICVMASSLVPEDVLQQHMSPIEARKRRRRLQGLDENDDEDEFLVDNDDDTPVLDKVLSSHRKVGTVVVTKKSPVSPLSDDEEDDDEDDDEEEEEENDEEEEENDEEEEESDEEEENDEEEEVEEDEEEENDGEEEAANIREPIEDGLEDDLRMIYLELIDQLRNKPSFSVIFQLLQELGWKKLYLERDYKSYICAPGIVEEGYEKGLCYGKYFMKKEFLDHYKKFEDYFDECYEKVALYHEVERRIPSHLFSYKLPSQTQAVRQNSKKQVVKKMNKKGKTAKKIIVQEIIESESEEEEEEVEEEEDDDEEDVVHVTAKKVQLSDSKTTFVIDMDVDEEGDNSNANQPLFFSPEDDNDDLEHRLWKELAMCLQEEPRKYSHILAVLLDLGWKKVYTDSDGFLLSPAIVQIAEDNNWYRDSKKVYVKKDMIVPFTLQSTKLVFNEAMDKSDLYAFLTEQIKLYKQSRPSMIEQKTPASAMITEDAEKEEPSTFQQKFRARDIAPLSASTTNNDFFVSSSAESTQQKPKQKKSKKEITNKVTNTTADEKQIEKSASVTASVFSEEEQRVRDTWLQIHEELTRNNTKPSYGTIARLMKYLGWLALYVEGTSSMCSPEMLAKAEEAGVLGKQKSIRGDGAQLFTRKKDYFVEGEDNADFYVYLQEEIRRFTPPLVHIVANKKTGKAKDTVENNKKASTKIITESSQFKSKVKTTTTEVAAEHPSTTRQIKDHMQRLALQTHSTGQTKKLPYNNNNTTMHSAQHSVATVDVESTMDNKKVNNARAKKQRKSVQLSPAAESISSTQSSELSVVVRLRRILKETPVRFSQVSVCLLEMGWEKKWYKDESYMCTPTMLAVARSEDLVNGAYLHKHAMMAFKEHQDYFKEGLDKAELFSYLRSLDSVDFVCPEPSLRMPTRSPIYPVRGWEDPSEAVSRLAAGEDDVKMSPRLATMKKPAQHSRKSPNRQSQKQKPRKLFADDEDDHHEQGKSNNIMDISEMDEDFVLDLEDDAFDHMVPAALPPRHPQKQNLQKSKRSKNSISTGSMKEVDNETKNMEEDDDNNDDEEDRFIASSQIEREDSLPCNMDATASDWDHVFDTSTNTNSNTDSAMVVEQHILSSKYDLSQWPEAKDTGLKKLLQENANIERIYTYVRDLYRWHRQFMRRCPGVRYLLTADCVTFRHGRDYGQLNLVENQDYFVDPEEMRRVLCEVLGVTTNQSSNTGGIAMMNEGRLSRRASSSSSMMLPPMPKRQSSTNSESHSSSTRDRKRRHSSSSGGDSSADEQNSKRIRSSSKNKTMKRQLTLDEEMAMLGEDENDNENEDEDDDDNHGSEEDNSENHVGDSISEDHLSSEDDHVSVEDESTWTLQKYVKVARRRLIAQSGGDMPTFPVPQRHEESLLIFDSVTKRLANGLGGVVHVVGAPGTGKTLTVHCTARRIMSLLRAAGVEHAVNFASTMGGIEDTADVLFSIAEQVGITIPSQCVTKNEKMQFISDRLKRPAMHVAISDDHASLSSSSRSNKNNGSSSSSSFSSSVSVTSAHSSSSSHSSKSAVPMTVLLIDELTDFRPATLRDLLALALHSPSSSLLIVATGNSNLLHDVSLVRPAMTTGAFKQIVFEPYDRDRLLGIIQARAGLLFDERAAVFLAAKVIRNENSDPRKLLERCDQAVANAVQLQINAGKDLSTLPVSTIVTVPVVMAMFGQADAARLAEFDKLAPYQRSLIIGLLIAGYELQGMDTKPFSVQDAHDAYHNYLAELRVDDEISLDSIAHYLQEICSYSFISVYRESMRRHQVGSFGHSGSGSQRFIMQLSIDTLLKSQSLAQELERKFLLRYQQAKQQQAIRDAQMQAHGNY